MRTLNEEQMKFIVHIYEHKEFTHRWPCLIEYLVKYNELEDSETKALREIRTSYIKFCKSDGLIYPPL